MEPLMASTDWFKDYDPLFDLLEQDMQLAASSEEQTGAESYNYYYGAGVGGADAGGVYAFAGQHCEYDLNTAYHNNPYRQQQQIDELSILLGLDWIPTPSTSDSTHNHQAATLNNDQSNADVVGFNAALKPDHSPANLLKSEQTSSKDRLLVSSCSPSPTGSCSNGSSTSGCSSAGLSSISALSTSMAPVLVGCSSSSGGSRIQSSNKSASLSSSAASSLVASPISSPSPTPMGCQQINCSSTSQIKLNTPIKTLLTTTTSTTTLTHTPRSTSSASKKKSRTRTKGTSLLAPSTPNSIHKQSQHNQQHHHIHHLLHIPLKIHQQQMQLSRFKTTTSTNCNSNFTDDYNTCGNVATSRSELDKVRYCARLEHAYAASILPPNTTT